MDFITHSEIWDAYYYYFLHNKCSTVLQHYNYVASYNLHTKSGRQIKDMSVQHSCRAHVWLGSKSLSGTLLAVLSFAHVPYILGV